MKETIKNTTSLIFSNWDTLLFFQITYKFLYIFLVPIGKWLLNQSLTFAHLSYITNENIFELFKNPLSILIIFLLILFIGIYIYIEFVAIVIYCKYGIEHKRLKVFSLYKEALCSLKKLLKPVNYPLFFYLLLLLPLARLPFNSVFFHGIEIPEFIMDFIKSNQTLDLIYSGIMLIIFSVILCSLFIPHEMILHDKNFFQSMKESFQILKKHFLQILIAFLIFNLLAYLGLYCIYIIGVSGLMVVSEIGNLTYQKFWVYFIRLRSVYELLKPIVIVSGNFSLITIMYYFFHKNMRYIKPITEKKHILKRIVQAMLLFFVLLISVELLNPNLETYSDITRNVAVVSHRGGGMFAPENSIPGIEEAIKNGSDYAEIDVQQTKDGILVLSHDSSLERIAHVSKEVGELTLEEIDKLYFAPEITNQKVKIPTLEDVIKKAKGKVKLVIELKKSPYDHALVEKTIALIQKYHFEKQCIVASLDLDLIKEVKKIDDSIKTSYIAALAYGDFTKTNPYVDIYSFVPTFLSDSLINELHDSKKKVFVWTVNQGKSVQKIMKYDIDGIITDNTYLTKYILDSKDTDGIVNQLFRIFRKKNRGTMHDGKK